MNAIESWTQLAELMRGYSWLYTLALAVGVIIAAVMLAKGVRRWCERREMRELQARALYPTILRRLSLPILLDPLDGEILDPDQERILVKGLSGKFVPVWVNRRNAERLKQQGQAVFPKLFKNLWQYGFIHQVNYRSRFVPGDSYLLGGPEWNPLVFWIYFDILFDWKIFDPVFENPLHGSIEDDHCEYALFREKLDAYTIEPESGQFIYELGPNLQHEIAGLSERRVLHD